MTEGKVVDLLISTSYTDKLAALAPGDRALMIKVWVECFASVWPQPSEEGSLSWLGYLERELTIRTSSPDRVSAVGGGGFNVAMPFESAGTFKMASPPPGWIVPLSTTSSGSEDSLRISPVSE